ncbi:MAG: cysteine desulfurase family protein [Myxococcota bacterium]
MIDLDHNATTPLDPRVRASMGELLAREDLGNPSSQHGRGRQAREVVEAARRRVAQAVEAEPLGVTFTSGGTEANNLAILGVARALAKAGRPHGVLTSALEHPSVAAAIDVLAAEGHPVKRIEVDAQGRIDPDMVAARLGAEPRLGIVSLAAANHELGNAYDIAAIARAAREASPQVRVHCDAVQAVGKLPVSFRGWGVDLLSISAHKLGGPAGAGALVHDRGLKLQALRHGGAQERGRRPGTEATLLVHGFGHAISLAASEQPARHANMAARRSRLVRGLQALGARIHGDPDHHTGNTVNVGFEGTEGELVMMNLDLAGIAVSTGAACSAGLPEPSPVLLALGQSVPLAREAVRMSLSPNTSDADIDAVLTALAEALPRIRKAGTAVRSAS